MCLKLEKGLDLICLVAVVAQFLQLLLLLLLLLLFLVVPLYTHPLLLYLKLKSTQVNSNHLTVRHFLSWRSMTKTFCDCQLPPAPCHLLALLSHLSTLIMLLSLLYPLPCWGTSDSDLCLATCLSLCGRLVLCH